MTELHSIEQYAAGEVTKSLPMSAGTTAPGKRKRKPNILAVINECCTGCSGSPVCQIYCPVDECMLLVAAETPPFQRIWVDPLRCVGCKKCISRGPEGTFLDGCPWDAIQMIATQEWESEHGELPY